MTVGLTELPPEGMQLGGVSLAGDADRGTRTTDGLSLLFTTAGITVQGPQPQIERLLVWSGLDTATCGEKIVMPDGGVAAVMELTSGGQSIRFLLPVETVTPGQAAYLDQALPAWLARYRGAVMPPSTPTPPEPGHASAEAASVGTGTGGGRTGRRSGTADRRARYGTWWDRSPTVTADHRASPSASLRPSCSRCRFRCSRCRCGHWCSGNRCCVRRPFLPLVRFSRAAGTATATASRGGGVRTPAIQRTTAPHPGGVIGGETPGVGRSRSGGRSDGLGRPAVG